MHWHGERLVIFGAKQHIGTGRNVSTGLIRGAPALSFKYDHSRDSERLGILISMTIWAIWKSINKKAINNQDVASNETVEVLKDVISDLVRKSWNATRFMEGGRRLDRSANSSPSGRTSG